ncbi:MAG: PAS domain S-box protein [Pseudomonadaceae bacterium]|nr:MAG: PAS domain S-box protein [Pseudomonadaceae bacterium]
MQTPEIPANETERLAALEASGLLFSASDPRFDRLTRLAQRLFGVDIALVSLIGENVQWFKSKQGLDVDQTERCISFCGHAIVQNSLLMVPDTHADARFADNPLVTGEPHIRFYAGVPLKLPGGFNAGTLCVINRQPMSLDPEQQQLLHDLAELVEMEISRVHLQEQLASTELTRQRLKAVIEGTNIGTWEWNVQTGETLFNARWAEMVGYTLDELHPISKDTWQRLAHPDDLSLSEQALHSHFSGEADFYDVVCRMQHKHGHWIWVHDRGRVISRSEDGSPLWMAGTHADVSDQVAARNALEQSESQYRSLVDNIPGVTYRCLNDENWTMLYMSNKVDPLSGYPVSDFINNQVRSYQSIIHPDDRHWLDQQIAEHIADKRPWLLEYRIQHRNGSVRWAQERGTPVFTPTGELAYLDGFILDITQSKNLQQEKRRQLQAFKTLSEISSFPTMDIKEQTLFALQRGADFLGLETGLLCRLDNDKSFLVRGCIAPASGPWQQGLDIDLTATLCGEVVSSNDLMAVADLTAAGLSNHPTYQLHLTRAYIGIPIRVDGRLYGVLSFSSRQAKTEAFSESEVLFLRLLGGWASASIERNYSVRALRLSEARLRGLFELSPYGIALNDYATGTFIDINSSLLASTGYTREEFLQLSYWQVTPQEYAEAEQEQLRSMEQTGRFGPYEKEYIRKDGTRYPVLLHGMVVTDANGKQLIWCYIEDISERKRIARLKDEFLSSVSHELRTPLTAINGALSLVNSGALGAMPAAATDMLSVAVKNSQRLLLLINDLLDMDKLLAGKMRFNLQWQPLLPMLETALEENQPFADQYQIGLRLAAGTSAIAVCVDAARLQQVMTNLLSNAVKFSPPGTKVRVTISAGPLGVRISVADQGPGIAEDFKVRIFEKFSQADSSDARQKGGTGLGLAITRELLHHMDGEISFDSEPGQGTVFHVDLPARADAGEY